jgi:UTP--glucose-1-phosphate uridylyltransferase
MKVRKAVFPAAGLGTRFLPATKAQPKEMLPLVDKPTIQYVVEEAVASGLEEIILVTGRNKRAIEDHFDAHFELEYYLQDRGKMDELAQIKTISEMASVRGRSSVTSRSACFSATTSSSPACRACASSSMSSSVTEGRCSR